MTFDNTYSMLRSKKIHYSIYLTPSAKKLNLLPTDEEVEAILDDPIYSKEEEIMAKLLD